MRRRPGPLRLVLATLQMATLLINMKRGCREELKANAQEFWKKVSGKST